MVNGGLDLLSGPCHLGLKRDDARLQLLNRKWIKVLPRGGGDGIVTAAGRQDFVHVHGMNVDAAGPPVNNDL